MDWQGGEPIECRCEIGAERPIITDFALHALFNDKEIEMLSIKELKDQLRRFVDDEDGLSATEYAILFVILVAIIAAGATALGGGITALFGDATTQLNSVGGP
ncbi:MAG TPA: hypothetical protein PK954_26180 [Anaerolineales bacterium]|nr:hypothetical protein [Anaerolineales bacterium]HRF49280.1 hypothetical protein [Anaerolineales bacterium]